MYSLHCNDRAGDNICPNELEILHLQKENNVQSIVLEIPENIVFHLKLPPKRAKQMLMEELVLRLYEQRIITSAQGAALLQMKRLRFEQFLAEHEVAIHGEPEELDTDLKNLERVGILWHFP